MKLYAVNAGHFKLDGGAMFGVVPKSLWHKANPADENNMCSWALRCMLVEHGERRILIDCGMGDKQDEKFFSHYYLHGEDSLERNLSKHGLGYEDITDVFLTHLHFDHCGGAVKRTSDGALVPAFPNAKYWTNRAHWDSATHPNAREKASFLKENILPLQEHGVLHFVDAADGEEWLPGFRIRIVNGHTDSMMLPLLTVGAKTLLYCADLLPSMHHIPLPWVMAYDMRPLQTLQEKEPILREAATNGWTLFFEHDPRIECATLVQTEKGIRVDRQLTLAEWSA
ncbi:MAG: MBL fold metallo-hydrolase [Sphingobacteriales bacterium]|nr:MAG: MBL fold metallo-hydrolase [Sphingobacteriales bacterium]